MARLTDEAKFLLVAGTDAPSQVMAITMYHVLSSVKIHVRLLEELQAVLPDASVEPSLSDLEQLPYLVSVPFREIILWKLTLDRLQSFQKALDSPQS